MNYLIDDLELLLKIAQFGHPVTFLYVSKLEDNLLSVQHTLLSRVNLERVTNRLIIVRPEGLTKISVPVHGAYVDRGAIGIGRGAAELNALHPSYIHWVDPETLKLYG